MKERRRKESTTAPAATIPADPADPAQTPPRLLKDVSREPYGRRALVAAAAEVFSERGYDLASIHGICKLAGTNVALVKYHFGSKEGLYEAVAKAVYEDKLSGFLDLVAEVHDAASWQAAMREWIRRFVEITGNPDSPRNFVARLVVREFETPSPLHDKIKARFYLPLRDGFAKLVRMAFPEHPDRQDQIRMALWSSALGALSFSHTAVRPGDTLVTVAQNLRLRNPLAVFAVRGYVNDTLVAEATIKCMIGQR